MPLILLGFIVVIGIVIYALVRYGQSDEEPRTMRERFPRAFEKFDDFADDIIEKMDKAAKYTVVDDEEEDEDGDDKKDDDPSDGGSSGSKGDGHTMHFPDNAEVEKIKRNIH